MQASGDSPVTGAVTLPLHCTPESPATSGAFSVPASREGVLLLRSATLRKKAA